MISRCLLFLCSLLALAGPVNAAAGHELSIAVMPSGTELIVAQGGRIQLMPIRGGSILKLSSPEELACCAAISPDGRHIAYQVADGSIQQIIVTDRSNTQRRQITFGNYDHRSPVWLPDSKRMLISSNRGGSYGIWELDTDSLLLKLITFDSGDELQPAVSTDGSRVIYVAENRKRPGIYTQQMDGPPVLLLPGRNRYRAPSWKPDGTVITYVVTDGDNTRLEMLIPSKRPVRKVLVRDKSLNPLPVTWISRDSFLYTAGEVIWERHFDRPWSKLVPIGRK